MLTETIYDRLKWFHDDNYQISDTEIVIQENKKDGEGEVSCSLSSTAIAFKNLEGRALYCLNNPKCADGIIFEQSGDDLWKLHIVELKSTMNRSKWISVKQQFEGALLNAYALMGILGIKKIASVNCYIAFKRDDFRDRGVADPASLKTQVGENPKQSLYIEWSQQNRIKVLSLNVDYKKVSIDPVTKTGTFELV